MTAVCMTHALNYLCFCIYFVYGIIWITYVPTLILSMLDNIDCQIGKYENLARDSFCAASYFLYRVILVTLLVLFLLAKSSMVLPLPTVNCCMFLFLT